MTARAALVAAVFVLLSSTTAGAQARRPTPAPGGAHTTAGLDSLFAVWATRSTPGCAVGATREGQPLFARAYGMANLEHDVPNTVHTVFEAGSVSKQFTAAAVLLLAADGWLALSDDVRQYVPELPDYGTPITIDHLLTHTSGLRDWGIVGFLAGSAREERVYTNADVLGITIRQRRLNHSPGQFFSYTNTGYNLLAVIVERVSGLSLADFTRNRLLAPLGMTSTRWRDDFRRTVPNRATAYRRSGPEFVQAMPFESTVGHGGLLTTVGDLLRWNEALRTGRLGAFVTGTLQQKVVLDGGRAVRYGRGLWIDTYGGHVEISHGGTTAGYNAWLGRYPAARLSVALLCNAPVNDVGLAHQIVDHLLPPRQSQPPRVGPNTAESTTLTLSPERIAELAGVFVSDVTGLPETFTAAGTTLTNAGEIGRPISASRIRFGWGDVVYETQDRIATIETNGERRAYWRANGPLPTADQLMALVGRYYSHEAAAVYVATVENGRLALRIEGHPTFILRLTPVGPDVLRTATTLVRVYRDSVGDIRTLAISASRVRELELEPWPRPRAGEARSPN